MAASDELKKARGQSYGDKPMDPDEPNETPRIVKLSDDEQKLFEGSSPGQELACEVRGNLLDDGNFRVMTIKPLGGGQGYDEQQMAGQVAGRLNPSVMPA